MRACDDLTKPFALRPFSPFCLPLHHALEMEFTHKDAATPLLSSTDAHIVQQKNEGVGKVVDDLRDLKSMADDMNRIVYEQQQFFDESEKNIIEADEHVSGGTGELALAAEYQASYRKKVCIIVAVVAVVLIVVLILILWGAGVFKKKKKA